MEKYSIAIVSPFPPPYGGMAIQAQKLVSLLRESGFKVIVIKTNADLPNNLHFMSKVKGLRTILGVLAFLKNLKKILPQVEVVYFLTGFFNFFFWVTYPALILIKMHGKKVILSAHGGEAGRFFRRYGIWVKPILKRVDAISVPSGFLQNAFMEAFNIETEIVPNIVDLNQFKYIERLSIKPKLLTTRSLEKIYNVACVIKAFKKVHDHLPGSFLGIVGDGSQRVELKKLVEDLNLSDRVTFYGKVEHERIQQIYDQYDVYVNASNVDNMPLTILEAFASGLPVVSTRAGGISYMVEDEVTGLLVDLNDHEGMAEKIIQLVKGPDKALILAQNARVECQKYSWEHIKKQLIPLLDKYISDVKN